MKHLPLLAVVLAALGCAARPATPARAAARISHDVFFVLAAPTDELCGELVADCARLREIPGVVHLTVGRRDETQVRDVNATDYHVGLHVEFESAAAYDAYGPHPIHQALLDEHGDRFASVAVYDTHIGR